MFGEWIGDDVDVFGCVWFFGEDGVVDGCGDGL